MAALERATVLVTGGAGYIGSHTVTQLLTAGCVVHVVYNLDDSTEESLRRVRELVGEEKAAKLTFHECDILDAVKMDKAFAAAGKVDAVIHFAGLKAVGESVAKPMRYYRNNIVGTMALVDVMERHGCRKIIFSSSATVYGEPATVPCTEEFPTAALNPYGRTKLFVEHILTDMQAASPEWKVILLRYFNPVGAHPSGRIGEDLKGIPNNLMPFIQQVAVGRRPVLSVFGDYYKTADGTGRRGLSVRPSVRLPSHPILSDRVPSNRHVSANIISRIFAHAPSSPPITTQITSTSWTSRTATWRR